MSVNRYGSHAYRNWRATVVTASTLGATWTASLFTHPCTVRVRYFRRLDRAKDVDNILKAILDGLDGKMGGHVKVPLRVLVDDRSVERVTSQRTNLRFHTIINARTCHRKEWGALIVARRAQAAVFVHVTAAPDHIEGLQP